MAGGNNHEIWTRFVEADYLIDAMHYEGKCPSCNSPRDCNNYYCLHCKQGGLCPATFRGQGAHHRHAWLQVRRQSHQSSVGSENLARFIGHESTKHIQKSVLNGSTLCYLRARIPYPSVTAPGSSSQPATTPPVGRLKRCKGCTSAIHNSQASTEEFLVCSVECLITVAQRQPELNLLQMNDGAMDPKDDFPLTALEKSNVTSKAQAVPGHVVDQPGSSSAGGIAPSEAPGGRGSSGRRTPPVDYRRLHEGGTDAASAGSSRVTRQSASRVQAPDDTANPVEDLSEGLLHLMKGMETVGDWNQVIGGLGQDEGGEPVNHGAAEVP